MDDDSYLETTLLNLEKLQQQEMIHELLTKSQDCPKNNPGVVGKDRVHDSHRKKRKKSMMHYYLTYGKKLKIPLQTLMSKGVEMMKKLKKLMIR